MVKIRKFIEKLMQDTDNCNIKWNEKIETLPIVSTDILKEMPKNAIMVYETTLNNNIYVKLTKMDLGYSLYVKDKEINDDNIIDLFSAVNNIEEYQKLLHQLFNHISLDVRLWNDVVFNKQPIAKKLNDYINEEKVNRYDTISNE